jgi:phenylpropionate dioxygenase-like ring-hydroxylating dioxygenase large terminal subunit
MAYSIDPDIAAAVTLPGTFYGDAAAFAASRERVFARSWQWIGDLADVAAAESLAPRDLLPGLLDLPLLLARDASGALRCLSNVCTHRGNLLVKAACRASQIRCGYHSRRFDLAGRMTFMPEFEGVRDFPSTADDLAAVPLATWGTLAFVALDPVAPFADCFDAIGARIGCVPHAAHRHDPSRDRDFAIDAHWALYVENYLEGFHIPHVHPALAGAVDYGGYRDELFGHGSVQIAPAKDGEPAFERREGGVRIAAYYAWLFPNLMLNVYPWGLSVNLVLPQGPSRTRVLFRSYVRDPALLGRGAGAGLDAVEREDEAIVCAVQRGVRSRFYTRGRYSTTRERGVHHFHRLLCASLGRV